jgi:hypothetical protein
VSALCNLAEDYGHLEKSSRQMSLVICHPAERDILKEELLRWLAWLICHLATPFFHVVKQICRMERPMFHMAELRG